VLFSWSSRFRKVQAGDLPYDSIELFPELDPLPLVLPELAFQMMPFTLFLLELFLDRFFFRPDPFVAGEELVDGCFQLLNVVESHCSIHRKTSCLSLVST